MYAKIWKENEPTLKAFSKAINKEPSTFVNEALGFYFAYIDALKMEKNAITILDDLIVTFKEFKVINITEEETKQINDIDRQADTLLFLQSRHFFKNFYDKYIEFKKVIGKEVTELPEIFNNTKLIEDFTEGQLKVKPEPENN